MLVRSVGRAGIMIGMLAVMLARAAGEPPSADKNREKLAKAKVEAARRTYEVAWANNREALVPFVEIAYRWSRRWLEAELDLSDKKADREKAYLAHSERMQRLARITRDRFQARANTVEEVTATEFYFAEAGLWYEQAKSPPRALP